MQRSDDFAVLDQLDATFKAIEAAWEHYLKKGLPKGIHHLKDVPEIKEPVQAIRKAIAKIKHHELKIAVITQMDGKISLPIAMLIFEDMRLLNLDKLTKALSQHQHTFNAEKFDTELKNSFETYIYGGTFGSGAELKDLEGDVAVKKFITDKVLQPFFEGNKLGALPPAEKLNLTQLLLKHIYLTCSIEVYIRSDLWQNNRTVIEKTVAKELFRSDKLQAIVRKPYVAISKLADMIVADEELKPLQEEASTWLKGLYYRIYNLVKPEYRVNGTIVPGKDGLFQRIDKEDETFFKHFKLTKAQVSGPHLHIAAILSRKFQGIDNFSLEIFEEFTKAILERADKKLSEMVNILNLQPPKARPIPINRSGSSTSSILVSASPDLFFTRLADGATQVVLTFPKTADPTIVRDAERRIAEQYTPNGKVVDPETLPNELLALEFESDKRKKCAHLATAIAKYQLTEYQTGCLNFVKRAGEIIIQVYRKWASSSYYLFGGIGQANVNIINEFERNLKDARDPREQLQACLKCCEALSVVGSKNILPLFYALILDGNSDLCREHGFTGGVYNVLMEKRPMQRLGNP